MLGLFSGDKLTPRYEYIFTLPANCIALVGEPRTLNSLNRSQQRYFRATENALIFEAFCLTFVFHCVAEKITFTVAR